MLGFDALGRLALGQSSDQAITSVVLVARAESFSFEGITLAFEIRYFPDLADFSFLWQLASVSIRQWLSIISSVLDGKQVHLALAGALGTGVSDFDGRAVGFEIGKLCGPHAIEPAGSEVAFIAFCGSKFGEFVVTVGSDGFVIILESWILVSGDINEWVEPLKQTDSWGAVTKISSGWSGKEACADVWTERCSSIEAWKQETI